MKTKNISAVIVTLCLLTGFMACQKTADFQINKPVIPGVDVSTSKWAFSMGDSTLKGCIDQAYTASANGIHMIYITGSDTSGNYINIQLSTQFENFTKETYTSTYSRAYMDCNIDSFYFSTYKENASFSFEITKITDSVIEGNYKAVLLDKAHKKTITIKAGTIRANLNWQNECDDKHMEPEAPSNNEIKTSWQIDESEIIADTIYKSDWYKDKFYDVSVKSEDRNYFLQLLFADPKKIEDGDYDVSGWADPTSNKVQAGLNLMQPSGQYYTYFAQKGTVSVSTDENGKQHISFKDLVFEDVTYSYKSSITIPLPKE